MSDDYLHDNKLVPRDITNVVARTQAVIDSTSGEVHKFAIEWQQLAKRMTDDFLPVMQKLDDDGKSWLAEQSASMSDTDDQRAERIQSRHRRTMIDVDKYFQYQLSLNDSLSGFYSNVLVNARMNTRGRLAGDTFETGCGYDGRINCVTVRLKNKAQTTLHNCLVFCFVRTDADSFARGKEYQDRAANANSIFTDTDTARALMLGTPMQSLDFLKANSSSYWSLMKADSVHFCFVPEWKTVEEIQLDVVPQLDKLYAANADVYLLADEGAADEIHITDDQLQGTKH